MTTPETTSERSLREVLLLPAVERTRDSRQSLAFVSRKKTLLGIALIFIIAVVIPLTVILTRIVEVPNVTGQTSILAEKNLKEKGLTPHIVERRFSVEKKGIVLDQSPKPSKRYRTTRSVSLIVSAGTERSTLEDFIGDSEVYATQALLQRGLVPVVVEETSVMLPGTVLATTPTPGSQMTTGESVTLRVASAEDAVPLVRYNLNQKNIVIVPEYFSLDGQDVTYDVALRLSSLLKASNAQVQVSRSSGDGAHGTLASAVSYVFLGIRKDGSSGMEIGGPVTSQTSKGNSSKALAAIVFNQLKPLQQNIRLTSLDGLSPKPPKKAPKGTIVSVSIGAADSPIDLALMQDVQFKDSVSRGIYRSIGEYLLP